MTVAVAPSASLDLGRVVSTGLGVLRRRPFALLLLALALGYLPSLAASWASAQWLAPRAPPSDLGSTFSRVGVMEGIALVRGGFGWILQGAVALVAAADLSGDADHLPGVLATNIGRAPSIFLLGIVGLAGISLGALLLVIPGLILDVTWSVCPAVAALEDRGFSGVFRRSANLTRGNGWRLFALLLVFGVISTALTFGVRPMFGAPLLTPGAVRPVLFFVVQPAIVALLSVTRGAVFAAAYLELRQAKEGLALHTLAATFD